MRTDDLIITISFFFCIPLQIFAVVRLVDGTEHVYLVVDLQSRLLTNSDSLCFVAFITSPRISHHDVVGLSISFVVPKCHVELHTRLGRFVFCLFIVPSGMGHFAPRSRAHRHPQSLPPPSMPLDGTGVLDDPSLCDTHGPVSHIGFGRQLPIPLSFK